MNWKIRTGKNAPNWKDKVGKSAVHVWLNVNYGKPQRCEEKLCSRKSKTFDWALKTGKSYEKERTSFRRLCRSCHKKYDWKPEYKLQAIKNLLWYGKSRLITFRGQTMSIPQWAKKINIKTTTLTMRILKYGWSIERAFNE